VTATTRNPAVVKESCLRQLLYLNKLLRRDGLPALMFIAAEHGDERLVAM
jgi:hypothetical protein